MFSLIEIITFIKLKQLNQYYNKSILQQRYQCQEKSSIAHSGQLSGAALLESLP